MVIMGTETQYTLYFCLMRSDGCCEYHECNDLLRLETKELYEVCCKLNELIRYSNLDYSVKTALLKIRNLREDATGLSLRQQFEIEHTVREYLWEYFTLVGHYDAMCKKYQDGELQKLFGEMRNSIEFHLAKVFRNYVTHAGVIVHNLSLDISQIYLYADRKTLLERLVKLGKEKDKKDIEILTDFPCDKIDVKYIVEGSYNKLADVQNCLNNILCKEQADNLVKIKRYYKLVNPKKYNAKRWMILGSDILKFGKKICLVDWDAYMRLGNEEQEK